MKMILYHEGRELITDWPSLFQKHGFEIKEEHDMIEHTMQTGDHFIAVYEDRRSEVESRYGKKKSPQSRSKTLKRLPGILQKYGSFPVICAQKPAA